MVAGKSCPLGLQKPKCAQGVVTCPQFASESEGKETVSALSTFASSSMANIPHVRVELATPRRSLSICGSICCPLAHIARSFFPLPSLLLGSIWNGRRCREDNRSELATISRSPLLRGERIGYRGSKAHRGTNIPIFLAGNIDIHEFMTDRAESGTVVADVSAICRTRRRSGAFLSSSRDVV